MFNCRHTEERKDEMMQPRHVVVWDALADTAEIARLCRHCIWAINMNVDDPRTVFRLGPAFTRTIDGITHVPVSKG